MCKKIFSKRDLMMLKYHCFKYEDRTHFKLIYNFSNIVFKNQKYELVLLNLNQMGYRHNENYIIDFKFPHTVVLEDTENSSRYLLIKLINCNHNCKLFCEMRQTHIPP